jgi:hypothetical protein
MFSPVFVIGNIRIGTVEGASCVNIGNNWPTGFENHSKTNQGFGNVSGDHNVLRAVRSHLEDSDLIDMMGVGDDDEIPDWLKETIANAPSGETMSKSDGAE